MRRGRDSVSTVVEEEKRGDSASIHASVSWAVPCPLLFPCLAQRQEDPILKAARMIYLNRTCYNGLYRVNKQGRFNVPFGRYKNPLICDPERLRAAGYALRKAELHCANYQETLRRYAKSGDFVYIDPPYHPVSKYSDFKRYTQEFFYKDDQRVLAKTVKELAQQGCYILTM